MKHYLVILTLYLVGSVLISVAQTNDATNAVANTNEVMASTLTNATTNAVEPMPAITSTNATLATTETNHPVASRPREKEKITIHSEGPYQMDLIQRWATYQYHVSVTGTQWKMTCEWLLANLPEHGEHITNIVAQTNVVGDFIDEKSEKWHVTGDKGVYAYHAQHGVTNETITLTGNPPEILEGQDSNSMRGDAIIYNVLTKKVTIENPTSIYWQGTNATAGTNSLGSKTGIF